MVDGIATVAGEGAGELGTRNGVGCEDGVGCGGGVAFGDGSCWSVCEGPATCVDCPGRGDCWLRALAPAATRSNTANKICNER